MANLEKRLLEWSFASNLFFDPNGSKVLISPLPHSSCNGREGGRAIDTFFSEYEEEEGGKNV